MACAKPPDLGRITPPTSGSEFLSRQTEALLDRVEHTVGQSSPGDVLDQAIAKAERALGRLRATDVAGVLLGRLEGRLAQLKDLGMERLRDTAMGRESQVRRLGDPRTDKSVVLREFTLRSAERNAKTAREALTKPGHWAHEAFKGELFRTIEQSGKIPDAYRETLLRDTSTLLRICPQAGGFVAAMTTRGQPRQTFYERLGSKGNDAVGSAYEIMATAALCESESRPANTRHMAPTLRIDLNYDKLDFGAKAFLNHKYDHNGLIADRVRKSVEADAHLWKHDPLFPKERKEVGIDFKHVKEAKTKGTSADLRNQIVAVSEKLKDGELHEYHFVTNGKFSQPFKDFVDKVNDDLVGNGDTPIAYHEYVTTLVNDPLADGSVGGDVE